MLMGGRLGVIRIGRCGRHSLKAALLVGVLALLPALAWASPRENPLPPLPVYKHSTAPPVITPPPDDGLENGGFYIEANELVHVRISDQPRHHLWTQFARQANLNALNVERGLVFDTAVLAVQYALSGEGIALVDNYLFADTIRTGQLVKPFENSLDDGYGYYLITHPEALSDTAIALFRSWLIERFGTGVAGQSNLHLAVSNE